MSVKVLYILASSHATLSIHTYGLCVRVCVCTSFLRKYACVHVVLDVDGAAFSCHHVHSRSQGADEALR